MFCPRSFVAFEERYEEDVDSWILGLLETHEVVPFVKNDNGLVEELELIPLICKLLRPQSLNLSELLLKNVVDTA